MQLNCSHEEFYIRYVKSIPGWLRDYTALRTLDILDWQSSSGVHGSLLEIGVFAGRYFSILVRSAILSSDLAVGLDTFQWVKLKDVKAHLAPLRPRKGTVKFINGPSTAYTSVTMILELGTAPRFISIDGSHEPHDVFWDLRLAEELLCPEGVVAVDDFLNPVALGVNQAVNQFFQVPRNLVPFAYIQNKLFLSRVHHAGVAMDFIETTIRRLEDERSLQWVKDRNGNPTITEAKLFGCRTLIVT